MPDDRAVADDRHDPSLWEKLVLTVVAVWAIGLGSYLVLRNEPFKDPNLVVIFRTMLSLGVAAFGGTIPGFLRVGFTLGGWTIRAGGALALFVVTFFGSPKVLPSLHISDAQLSPFQYPPETIIDSVPNGEQLTELPKRPPNSVNFSYKNDTDTDMKLYLYDFWRRYQKDTQPGTRAYWVAFPFPANGLFSSFDRFEETNGWIGFAIGYVGDNGSIQYQYLETKNIFYSDTPSLVVDHVSGNNLFTATFGTRGE